MKRSPIPEARAQVLLRRVAELYAQNLANQPEPKRWLADHGFPDPRLWASHRLGASNGILKGVLPSDNGILTELTAIGVFDSEGHETFVDCIVCPVCAEPGGIQTLVGWPMNPAGPVRRLANGPSGLWNANVLTTATEVYLATSVLEGLSIAACGIANVIAAVGEQPNSLQKQLREHGVHRVRLVAGDTADAQASAQRLKAGGFGLITLPGAASVNQFLVANGPAELARLLTAAPPAGGVLDGAELLPDGFILHCKERRYELRGLEKTPRALRATVRLTFASKMHLDTIDLYCARARRQFIGDVTRLLDEAASAIEADIGRILLAAEERVAQLRVIPQLEVVMTEADREQAEALAKNPDLPEQILRDFETCGLMGERTNKLLCYLAITSRKLSEPLAVLILASSGAGKTALQEAALAFCPPEDVVKVTSLSGRALFYKERASLKHKVLAVAEGEGLTGSDYALRNLISAGELVTEVTIRDQSSGRLATMTNKVEGPTAVLVTTTDPETDAETKSRFIVTSMDESPKQTLAILAWQRRQHSREGLEHIAERQEVLRRHWALQRLLEPLAVVNPFANQLCFGDDRLTSRRDQPKYLRLMAAVALLRQRQKTIRRMDGPTAQAYIEVDTEDVRLANAIAMDLFGRSLDELSRPSHELLVLLDQMRRAQPSTGVFSFCRRDVREFGRWSHARVHRYLKELLELEYVWLERAGGCHRYRLRWDGSGQDGQKFLLGLQAPAKG